MQGIVMRRFEQRMAVTPDIAVALVIGEDEEDVGLQRAESECN